MYDATGKLPSGVLSGNFMQIGSFDECIEIDALPEQSNVTGKYCLGHLLVPSDYIKAVEQLPSYVIVQKDILFGLCFPNLCSAADIESITKSIGLNLTANENECQTKNSQSQISTGGYVTLGIAVLILILVIASTTYELTHQGIPHWALKSFSICTNWKSIFHISKRKRNQITCFYGLRTFGLMAVICYHTHAMRLYQPIANFYYMSYAKRMFVYIILFNLGLQVDIFFVLSGYLVSHNFLQSVEKGYKFNIFLHYVGRYLRLAPSLICLLLFMLTWFMYMGSGPFWNSLDKEVEVCRTNWWPYLLHIQNFWSKMCIAPTWYLSVDFQLYILSPALLIPLKRWPKVALAITSLLILLSMAVTFGLAWTMKLCVTSGSEYVYFNYYFSPTRCAPWFIGFLFGYISYSTKEKEHITGFNKITTPLLIVALLVIIICILGEYHIRFSEYNRLEHSFFMTLVRPAFSVALGYIVYCCQMGYADVINRFLSISVFEVISRLSYNMYLVHCFVLWYMTYSIITVPFVSVYNFLINDFCGALFLTFVSAIIISLCIELPAQHFIQFFMNRAKKKNA